MNLQDSFSEVCNRVYPQILGFSSSLGTSEFLSDILLPAHLFWWLLSFPLSYHTLHSLILQVVLARATSLLKSTLKQTLQTPYRPFNSVQPLNGCWQKHILPFQSNSSHLNKGCVPLFWGLCIFWQARNRSHK